jgi:hypothetical protein
MEAIYPSQTSVDYHQATRRYVPEDRILPKKIFVYTIVGLRTVRQNKFEATCKTLGIIVVDWDEIVYTPGSLTCKAFWYVNLSDAEGWFECWIHAVFWTVLNHVKQVCCQDSHDGRSSGIGWQQMAGRFLNHFKWARSDHGRFSDWEWSMWPPDMEYLPLYSFTILCWTLAIFSVSYSYTQSVGLLGRGVSPSQGRYLHTGQHKHRINAYTDIHALSGIRTHNAGVRADKDN